MVIVSKYLIPKGYAAMAVFPFIILSHPHYRSHPVLLNHEKIHLRQQAEMLVLPFYIWYITEYLLRLLKTGNRKSAYRRISFEAEAYAHEHDPEYLKTRRPFTFLHHLR